jgi:hypothetical protein
MKMTAQVERKQGGQAECNFAGGMQGNGVAGWERRSGSYIALIFR